MPSRRVPPTQRMRITRTRATMQRFADVVVVCSAPTPVRKSKVVSFAAGTATEPPIQREMSKKRKQKQQRRAKRKGVATDDGDEEYTVEMITSSRYDPPSGQMYFYVIWKGSNTHTWEPYKHVKDCAALEIFMTDRLKKQCWAEVPEGTKLAKRIEDRWTRRD